MNHRGWKSKMVKNEERAHLLLQYRTRGYTFHADSVLPNTSPAKGRKQKKQTKHTRVRKVNTSNKHSQHTNTHNHWLTVKKWNFLEREFNTSKTIRYYTKLNLSKKKSKLKIETNVQELYSTWSWKLQNVDEKKKGTNKKHCFYKR
jgi:hypothetical protein